MGDTFAILALRRKRARLAGEIEAIERTITPLRLALPQLDAVIRLFEPKSNPELIPAIRPTRHGLFFRRGEQARLILSALRDAGKPVRAPWVAEHTMLVKGIPVDDAEVRTAIATQTRVALARLEKRGSVRRIIQAPETWWELME